MNLEGKTLAMIYRSREGKPLALTRSFHLRERPSERGHTLTLLAGEAEVGTVRVDQMRPVSSALLSGWSARDDQVATLLAYAAVRRARTMGHTTIAAATDVAGPPPALLGLEPVAGTPIAAQRVDLAAFTAWRRLPAWERPLPGAMVQEICETAERWLETVPRTRFFAGVQDGTVTRQQFIYAISNMHAFVRWTTRLLGRAVSVAHDPDIRNHYLAHLQGELNHEKIIEKDLEALGADVSFVTDVMAPNPPTRAFMANQEALIGFGCDPVLFAASPLAAEGIAAHFTVERLEAMNQLVASWGIPHPSNATRFFFSHTNFDGGEDGHWVATLKMLERHLCDEPQLQAFLTCLRTSMRALSDCYDSYVTDLEVFGTA